jgi:hypothetical protein
VVILEKGVYKKVTDMELPDKAERFKITLTGYQFNGSPVKGTKAVIRYEYGN